MRVAFAYFCCALLLARRRLITRVRSCRYVTTVVAGAISAKRSRLMPRNRMFRVFLASSNSSCTDYIAHSIKCATRTQCPLGRHEARHARMVRADQVGAGRRRDRWQGSDRGTRSRERALVASPTLSLGQTLNRNATQKWGASAHGRDACGSSASGPPGASQADGPICG